MDNQALSARISAARRDSDLTQSQLSRLVGVTRAAISQWETGFVGDMKCRYFFPLARALKIDPEELYWGIPSVSGEFARASIKFVPLIPLEEIEDVEKMLARNHTEFIPTTKEDVDRGFAVHITSDSMMGQNSPFPKGATVIFDGKATWKSGDYVLASPRPETVMFRQIMVEGDQVFLKPLNSQYPTVETDGHVKVLGVAVQTLNNL